MIGKVILRALAAAAAVCATLGAAPPPHSDFLAVPLEPDPAPPGGKTLVRGLVSNLGPDRAVSPFTVIIALPRGFAAERPEFPSSCSVYASGRLVTCAFPAGLSEFETAIVMVPVRVNSNAPLGTKAEGYVRVVNRDDRNPVNNRATFTLSVLQ